MWDFSEKTFMITGASSGIGKDAAEYLTRELHANVVLVARRENVLDTMLEQLPGKNFAIVYDLKNIENIGDIFSILEKKKIRLDGLVYSAGIAPLFALKDNQCEDMLDTMKVNALAFAEMGKYFLKSPVVNENASVVAVSSIVSKATTNRQSAYAASKSMLNTYVKYIAKEALFSGEGGCPKLRVNAVLPGIVETEMTGKLRLQSENYDEKVKKNSPLGLIPVRKVSKLIAYLLSEDASYITGSLLTMDSGFLLK